MSTYVIGDIQGCFSALENLLSKIHFDPSKDVVWFTGDLVNRGPQSLETLRFVKTLGSSQRVVLGNHDLHLLAMAHGAHKGWPEDTLLPILNATDRDELIDWLLHQPLLLHENDFVMVHAGLAASWDLATAKRLSKEVETVLQSDKRHDFFKHMYGDLPNQWHESLISWDRIRCITNFLTRARLCSADGSLELTIKENMTAAPPGLFPWFRVPNRAHANLKIIFGHWAALGGVTNTANVYAMDTGCVWGFCLTAMCLETMETWQVSCERPTPFSR